MRKTFLKDCGSADEEAALVGLLKAVLLFDTLINNSFALRSSRTDVFMLAGFICTCTDSSEVNVLLLKTHYSVLVTRDLQDNLA